MGVISLILIIFVSCSDKGGGYNGPGPGDPPPAIGAKPVVTAGNPAKGWFNGSITGSFGVTSTDPITGIVIKANGVVVPNEAGYSYTLNNVTGSVQVEIAVTNKNGTTTAYANADVYSLTKTNYCNTGDWKLNKTFINGALMPSTCYVYRFSMENDIMKFVQRYSLCEGLPDSPAGPCNLDEGNFKITFGSITYTYSDLSSTFLKLSYTNTAGQAVVKEFGH